MILTIIYQYLLSLARGKIKFFNKIKGARKLDSARPLFLLVQTAILKFKTKPKIGARTRKIH